MPSIRSIGTALPSNSYSLDELKNVGEAWLHDHPSELERFTRFLISSKAEGRNFAIPAPEILKLNGMQHRGDLFELFGPKLGEAALRKAMNSAGLKPVEIESLIFTSCSCPSIPAIDALIIERMEMKRETRRIPIYQHGCAGGVVGLQLASELARSGKHIALTSVELCSLVFQGQNPTPAQLVGSAIFADGAASALVGPEDRGMVIKGCESYIVPDSRHLMGYDILDDGFHLRLDRELPKLLSSAAPERVRSFLRKFGTSTDEINFWLFHPGGIKILDLLESTFALKPGQARWSREVLQTVGNLSSATVLFVLNRFLESNEYKDGDKVVMLGVGPGLTLELILFEYIAE